MGVNAPTQVEAPPVRLAEAAQLHGKAVIGAGEGSKDKAVVASRERAKQLKEFDSTHKDAKDGIVEARNKRARPLSPTELTQLRKVDPKLADEAEQFNTYTDVMAEAVKTGKTPGEVAKSRGDSDFDKTRTAVVDRLAQLDVFQGMDEFKAMNPQQQRDFVESTVGTNDRVRAAYLREMRKIGTDAAALPEQQKVINEGISPQQARREIQIGERVNKRLGNKNHVKTYADVMALLGDADTPEEARMKIMDQMLKDNGIEPAVYRAFQEAQLATKRLDDLQRGFLEVHKKGPYATGNFDLNAYLDKNGNDPKVAEYQALQARMQATAALRGKIQPENPQTSAAITDITDKVYGTIDYSANGQPRVGGIEKDLKELFASRAQDTAAQSEAPTQEQLQTQQQAEAQKAALGERMQKALAEAVEDTLDAQIDEARAIAERKMLAETADKDEAEKTIKDRALVRLADQQDHNWIGMDEKSGHRTVNYDVIGHDVRYAGAHGEEGVKRLQLRDLMMGGEGAVIKIEGTTMGPDGIIKNADGSDFLVDVQERQADGTYVNKKVQGTWENIPLDKLPAEGKSVLESVFAQTKDGYVTRMFMDLEQARHPHSLKEGWKILGNLKNINLTRDEIVNAHNKLGNLVVDGVRKGKEGDQILKKLEGMGLDVTNEGKKGILPLLMMLIMLLGGFKKKE